MAASSPSATRKACSPCLLGPACESEKPADDYTYSVNSPMRFLDSVKTNVQTVEGMANMSFTDFDGNEVPLKDLLGKKHTVLVITRGYPGQICLYCSTQTSRLIANYDEFAKRDTQVLVAFPIKTDDDKDKLDEFVKSARNMLDVPVEKVPFPILLDLKLKVVDQLGIRKDLAKPATYILDNEGQVRFAYVGNSIAQRPSIKAILEQLDELNAEDR